MFEELAGRCSLGRVSDQHLVQEAFEQRRDLVQVLQLGRQVVSDHFHGFERRLVEVWRLSVHHLYHHDPQRPDIHLWSVRQPGDELRRHPVRRPNQRLPPLDFL